MEMGKIRRLVGVGERFGLETLRRALRACGGGEAFQMFLLSYDSADNNSVMFRKHQGTCTA